MKKQTKLDYFERMIIPYEKGKKKKYFIMQYLSADGHELKSKFWSKHSSSRLAFELYSWLANEDFVIDFEFEYKLEGLYRSPKKPNMDVYIETKDEIIFIESKYTETSSQNLNGLSESYYLESGKNSLGGDIKSSLSDRYYGRSEDAKRISDFIINIKSRLEINKNPSCWMDYKQEVAHLVGIYFHLKSNPNLLKKRIRFYNIFVNRGVFDNNDIKYFFNEAHALFVSLFPNIDFVYEYHTVQEMIQEIKSRKPNVLAYGVNRKVLDVLKCEFGL